jgi:hypothetical protein
MLLNTLSNQKWQWLTLQTVVTVTFMSLCLSSCSSGSSSEDNTGTGSDASLSGLTLTDIALDQPFQADLLDYSASVDFTQDTITLTPVAATPDTTILVNGDEVASGSTTAVIELIAGQNLIEIVVTTIDGSATSTYTLEVFRSNNPNPSSDASLGGLTLIGATLEQLFQPNQTAYSASVGYLQASVTLIPVATDANATIQVNGNEAVSGSASAEIALAEGQNIISLVLTAEDGVTTQRYSIEILREYATSFAQQAYLKANNAEGELDAYYSHPGDYGDQLGHSVAISGETLVVGAPGKSIRLTGIEWSDSKINFGAVYVFTRSNGIWSQQAYLEASNAEAGDQFGASVAISGDTLVVGAIGEDSSISGGEEDNSAFDAGAVYIFTRSGGAWNQQALLKPSYIFGSTLLGVDGNEFGYSVAISGDTLVVGSPNADSSDDHGLFNEIVPAPSSGAVFVFTRNGEIWSQQASLKASNAEEDDGFGTSVAISNDTLVVGAPGEDSSASGGEADNSAANAGSGYVFTRRSETWSQQAILKASNAGEGDFFGTSVAISGDTLVVGAIREDSSASGGGADNSTPGAGAVYVFTRSGEDWSQQTILKASNAGGTTYAIYDFNGDHLGASVAISGDTLVVGASGEDASATGGEADNSSSGAGAAYVFTRNEGAWSQQAYLKARNAETQDTFGNSVAISGDTLVVGAPGEDASATGGEADNSSTGAGAAYTWQ